jgi:hypothetical protein
VIQAPYHHADVKLGRTVLNVMQASLGIFMRGGTSVTWFGLLISISSFCWIACCVRCSQPSSAHRVGAVAEPVRSAFFLLLRAFAFRVNRAADLVRVAAGRRFGKRQCAAKMARVGAMVAGRMLSTPGEAVGCAGLQPQHHGLLERQGAGIEARAR